MTRSVASLPEILLAHAKMNRNSLLIHSHRLRPCFAERLTSLLDRWHEENPMRRNKSFFAVKNGRSWKKVQKRPKATNSAGLPLKVPFGYGYGYESFRDGLILHTVRVNVKALTTGSITQ
jgi:hypothetical protein